MAVPSLSFWRVWRPRRVWERRIAYNGSRRHGGGSPVAEPVKRTKLYEEVAARIHAMIAGGELKPGQALPSERKLAAEFGVGRTVLREAVRRLETSGLVSSRHGGGNYVREVTAEQLVAPLASILSNSPPLKGELMDARLFFEPQIARGAAARATPEDLRLMEDAVRRQVARVSNGESAAREDAEFHALLAQATHNTVVERVTGVINDLLEESGARPFRDCERSRHSLDGNRRILEAVRRRDQDAAQRAMEAHIEDIAHNF